MDQTKVDDMLIEMITPKVTEIQQKFSDGGSLTQDDINTLLLKSQYNHINHLDLKLNEVVSDVASLKGEFTQLETSLRGDMSQLEISIRGEFNQLKVELNSKFDLLTSKFDLSNKNMEKLMAKAVNKNMTLLIFVMGFFLTYRNL